MKRIKVKGVRYVADPKRHYLPDPHGGTVEYLHQVYNDWYHEWQDQGTEVVRMDMQTSAQMYATIRKSGGAWHEIHSSYSNVVMFQPRYTTVVEEFEQ